MGIDCQPFEHTMDYNAINILDSTRIAKLLEIDCSVRLYNQTFAFKI